MNCESKICLLKNVRIVNRVYVRSIHHKISSGLFLTILVVIPGLTTLAGFTSPLKLNMYSVWIRLKCSQIVSPV